MTQRDWQKDMEMFEEVNKAALTWLGGRPQRERITDGKRIDHLD